MQRTGSSKIRLEAAVIKGWLENQALPWLESCTASSRSWISFICRQLPCMRTDSEYVLSKISCILVVPLEKLALESWDDLLWTAGLSWLPSWPTAYTFVIWVEPLDWLTDSILLPVLESSKLSRGVDIMKIPCSLLFLFHCVLQLKLDLRWHMLSPWLWYEVCNYFHTKSYNLVFKILVALNSW